MVMVAGDSSFLGWCSHSFSVVSWCSNHCVSHPSNKEEKVAVKLRINVFGLYQSDRVIENAYELIDSMCKIVGFAKLEPEDE